MQPDISKWNVAEMAYVGAISSVNSVFVRRKDAPAKTIEEMKTITSTVACTGRTSFNYKVSAILKNLGGFKFKIVCGYQGSAEVVLALNRLRGLFSRLDQDVEIVYQSLGNVVLYGNTPDNYEPPPLATRLARKSALAVSMSMSASGMVDGKPPRVRPWQRSPARSN